MTSDITPSTFDKQLRKTFESHRVYDGKTSLYFQEDVDSFIADVKQLVARKVILNPLSKLSKAVPSTLTPENRMYWKGTLETLLEVSADQRKALGIEDTNPERTEKTE